MKKLIFASIIVLSISFSSAFTTSASNGNGIENPVLSSVKIVNDTDEDIRIHTGSGHVMLNHGGGSTSVECEEGRKISYSNGSKATGLIFTIDNSMCGKTVKLSTYIK